MLFHRCKIAAFVAIAVALGLGVTPPAHAGSTVSGGWQISWDDSSSNVLSPSSAGPSQTTLTSSVSSYALTFQQLNHGSSSLIAVPELSLVNGTGQSWSGIILDIKKGTTGVLISPTFSGGSTTLTLESNVADGGTWSSALESLLIAGGAVRSGATLQSFVLTATPQFATTVPGHGGGGGNGSGGAIVPLPAAAWPGLAVLGMVIAARARTRKQQQ
jgi:hypothetical protein